MTMFRVRTVFTAGAGSPWLSTLMFNAGGISPSAQAAAAAAGTFWGAVDSQMHDDVSWTTGAVVDEIDVQGAVQVEHPVTPVTGSGSQTTYGMLPAQVQALCSLNTGAIVGGRRIRGRIFVPGLTEDANISNALSSTTRTVIQNALNALIADSAADLQVWSRATAGQLSVISGTVRTKWATLRSRND